VETLTYGQVLARFGHALSDPIRARLLLALRDGPGYPADLAQLLGTSRQNLSNHLACLRGCGLVAAVPEGRRTRYELSDGRLAHALGDLLGLVLAEDPVSVGVSTAQRDVLARRVRVLVATTISYNVVEAVVAVTAGVVASSTALVGFGLDSVIEVSSAAAVAWQFAARDHAVREAREKVTLRIIAVSFFALALYVALGSVRALLGHGEARQSLAGLVLAAVSLVVMPLLSAAQRRAGRQLGSATAVADSKQTLLCTYLSGVLLVGLALNSLFGWSWADPVAGFVIALVAVREGREAWRGDTCCAIPSAGETAAGEPGTAGGCCSSCLER
jgi:DNA-binding transcriptional ArsR family regulator